MMSYENTVSEHYTHGELFDAIRASIAELGKTVDSVTVDDLAPVDEFHIGGRLATDHLIGQLGFSEDHHILDVGCGLGGASRFVSNKLNNQVTGIDLTREYIDVGNSLCRWVGLDNNVSLQQGSALSMPFGDQIFDGAFMLHVGMNIADKSQLFSEVFRVLQPGAQFGVYDVMQISDGELAYPVPWAADNVTSKLESPDYYRQTLIEAGFKAGQPNVRREFALDFFKQMKAKTKNGLPPIGLHILMQESTAIKVQNMIENIEKKIIAPVEIIAQKL